MNRWTRPGWCEEEGRKREKREGESNVTSVRGVWADPDTRKVLRWKGG